MSEPADPLVPHPSVEPPALRSPVAPAAAPIGRTGARDECGVMAVFARTDDPARLCFYGLYALQHRGQESAGIAVSDGDHILVSKEMGLVNQVFEESRLASLKGHMGVGHVRYSTTGASTWDNAQPTFQVTPAGGALALGHNGNLVATEGLESAVGPAAEKCRTDSDLLSTAIAAGLDGSRTLADQLEAVLPAVRGAFSLVVMDEHAIHGVRDPHGVRPLVVGRLPRGGYVLASETAALDIIGAHFVRDVEPGEIVTVDGDGLHSRRFAPATPHFCSFEYVYLARPDHRTRETTVYSARRTMGRLLAAAAPVDADLVIPVPDSGTAAAAGYAEALRLPYGEGLVKNRYVGRTFIQPSESLRQLGIRMKLNPLPDVLRDKRLVVVDDSIVRGSTSRQLVGMLREAGAAEIHLRITAPPVRHPCYYGIDMATRAELIGSGLTVEEIRDFTGADSLAYLSLDDLVRATGRPRDQLCRACFDGQYPIAVPGEEAADAQLLLDMPATADR